MALQDIPFQLGKRVDPNYSCALTNRLAELLNTKKGFPGSKAIPFQQKHFELIETEDYFVCEKTPNGRRFLLFFFHSAKGPASFLLDKHQEWYFIPNLVFPVRTKENEYLRDTILDGELVLDNNTWRFRVFDMLVINGSVITQRSFNSRLGMLQQDVIQPFQSKARKENPPIIIELKKMERAYGLHLVFDHISAEQHNIIWTPVKHPYTLGQSEKLLVWTPSELNRVFLRIAAKWSRDHKPMYSLEVAQGVTYKFYDYFKPEPSLALKWRDQLPNGRIAEFRYDPKWEVAVVEQGYAPTIRKGGWRFVSFRDEKTTANDEQTVNKILNNIQEGVTKDQFMSHIDQIRAAWKAREKGLPMPLSAPVEKSVQQQYGVMNDTMLDSPISLSPSNSSRPSSLSEQGETHIINQDEGVPKLTEKVVNSEPLKKRKAKQRVIEEEEPMQSFSNYCSISGPTSPCKTTKIPINESSKLKSPVLPTGQVVQSQSISSNKPISTKFKSNDNDTKAYTTSPSSPPSSSFYVYNNNNNNSNSLRRPINTNSTPTTTTTTTTPTSFTSHIQYRPSYFSTPETEPERNSYYYTSRMEAPQPKRSRSCSTKSNLQNLLTTNKDPESYHYSNILQSVKETQPPQPQPLQFINFHAERHNPEEHVLIIRSESHTNDYTSAPVELSYPVVHPQQHKKPPKSAKSKLDFILN